MANAKKTVASVITIWAAMISGALLLIGMVFKIQHYPGASIMLMVGFLGIIITLIAGALLLLKSKLQGPKDENPIPNQAASANTSTLMPPIPGARPGNRFENTPNDNTLPTQLKRAGSLLQLNIVNPNEFGTINANIASGKFVLSHEVYHDVVNLKNMKERQTIDDFMYDMQRTKMLELKYLPQ